MAVIRKATEKDIPQISEIYDRIIESGASTGWIKGVYPTEKTARTGLASDDLFVYEDGGKILASARINKEQVDVYAECEWSLDLPESEIMVLHTLTVNPAFSGHGIGKRFVAFYEDYAKENGCRALRLDTNEINTAARSLYAKLGYKEVGIVPCNFNGIPDVMLVCIEKILA